MKDTPKKAGTPGWAPPEQFLGISPSKEDHFALGRLLVYMFSSWQTAWPLLFHPKDQILKLYDAMFNKIETKAKIKIDREAGIIDIIEQIRQTENWTSAAVGREFDKTLIKHIYEQLTAMISGTVSLYQIQR